MRADGDGVSGPTRVPGVMSMGKGSLGTVVRLPISQTRRLSQGYSHFQVRKPEEEKQDGRWGGSGEKKVGLVDRLGLFWVLSGAGI